MLPVQAEVPESRRKMLIQATGAEWSWMPATIDVDARSKARGGGGAATGAEGAGGGTSKPGSEGPERSPGTLIRNRLSAVPAPAHQGRTGLAGVTRPALLVETSGSSAEPKIVMLSAANIIASCRAVNRRLELRAGDRWLCVLPRHHVAGLAISYRSMLGGAELQLQWPFRAEATRAALWDGSVTHLSLVPAQLERLLNLDASPPASLRAVLLGGQGLDKRLARRAVNAGWPLYLGYGMSETFSQIAGNWIGADGSSGRGLAPLDGVELDCPGCVDGLVEAQALRIRAPMLMLGYANRSRTPGDGLDNGWLQTSDLACRLPDGGLQVLGRADDVVLIAGMNVLPAEIELELARLDGIGEVAVVGVPDPTWGHRLVALYTGHLEQVELEAWCRHNLPSHRRPRAFARLERLPMLGSGKRDRRALITQAAAAAGNGNNIEGGPGC